MTAVPELPRIGPPTAVAAVSASESENLLTCPLRFVLNRDRSLRRFRRYAASALVGTAAHAALASLARAQRSGWDSGSSRTRNVARVTFDEALVRECRRRDAAIAERGVLPGDCTEPAPGIPFYAMTRARLARFSEQRFGDRWSWRTPSLDAPRAPASCDVHCASETGPELPLESLDGKVRGTVDHVARSPVKVIVEEFKTGEATSERLASWKHQLLIYAWLYRERHGVLPAILRVHSLPSGLFEFVCTEEEARQAIDLSERALDEVNARIAAGASAEALARPFGTACRHCPHRAWCEAYWAAAAQMSSAADVDGWVVRASMWEAELRTGGGLICADLKALRIAPQTGMRLRICDARVGLAGKLICERATSVWRVQR